MKLYYREFGEGVPYIILHGLYGSSDNWASIARVLSDNFRVIVPDLRNHGRSPHSDEHTFSAMAADIIEMLDSLGIDRFFLAGHSMGGKCAISIASSAPERILGLVVVDISPFRPLETDNPATRFHRLILDELTAFDFSDVRSRDEAEEKLAEKISSPRIRQFILKNITRLDDNSFAWNLNVKALLDNLDNKQTGFDRKLAGQEQFRGYPVIFIRGSESDYIPVEDIDLITSLFPSSEIVNIPGASHWVHADEPGRVISILRSVAE